MKIKDDHPETADITVSLSISFLNASQGINQIIPHEPFKASVKKIAIA